MTLAVRARPFVIATVIYSHDDAESVTALLEAIAPDQSLAFLFLEDDGLAEDDRQAMRERITGSSRLRLESATFDDAVEPNAMYFVPRRRVRALQDGVLQLHADDDAAAAGIPFSDVAGEFFGSMASDQGRHGCVIQFAGVGASGAVSDPVLAPLAEAQGLVLVQDVLGGPFRRLGRSVNRAERITTLVPLDELSNVLLEHAEPVVAEVRPRSTSSLYEAVEKALPRLCDAMLLATEHDFHQYKPSTLIRRTLRRLHMIRCDDADDYVRRIEQDRTEALGLFQDLLVSVTSFFRDPEAFRALATHVVPRLFDARAAHQPVRVWVPGCATGEEAYSIAMLLHEHAATLPGDHPIQVFATDLDERALGVARQGEYPALRLAHVTPERVHRFFARSGATFRVSRALRDSVLFSRHNLTTDAPFSNIDLLSCRNVLIYLGEELQQRLIPLFHYALRPNGYLFLGPSESLTSHHEFFRPIDVKHRISQRAGSGKRVAPLNSHRVPRPVAPSLSPSSSNERDPQAMMHDILTAEYLPDAVTMTEDGNIVAVSGDIGRYLKVSAGSWVNSVLRLVREGLRVAVRSALRDAITTQGRVVHEGGTLRTGDGIQHVTVSVQPLSDGAEASGLYLLVFQPHGAPLPALPTDATLDVDASHGLIERLEADLSATRDELQRTVQDLEAVNEELKSSNEELISMNEELQSSNEELEASKDELETANDTLEDTNSDLANLLSSTRIPAIFLDRDGLVKRATPSASLVYNLLPEDIGRPLAHFTHNAVQMPALPPMSSVLASTHAIEDEIDMRDGTYLLRRVLPYVTADGANEGMVVTFVDITERHRHNTTLRSSEARFRQLAETIPQLAWMAHPDGNIFWYNQRWYDYTGTTYDEMRGWGWTSVHDPEVLPSVSERWGTSIANGLPFDMVFPLRGADGVFRPFLTRINPLRDERGAIVMWFGTNTDLSEERAHREALRQRQRELQMLADNSPDILVRFDRHFRHVFANAALERLTGTPLADFLGRTNREIGMPDVLVRRWEDAISEVFRTGVTQHITFEFDGVSDQPPADGEPATTMTRYFEGRLVPELGAHGEVEFVLGVTRDRTAERVGEMALAAANRRKDEFLATLAHELRNPLAPVRNGLEILRLSADDSDGTAEIRNVMERQIVTMTRLIDDLLDISRISLGKVELRRASVAVKDIIADALEVSRPLIDAANHTLHIDIPDEALLLDADATRLSQVVGNLLNNAAKYTPPGGRISVSARQEGASVVIVVADNGIGIPRDMLAPIFEMFTQLDHPKTSRLGGLGIGLALVRQLVEMHGGEVHAESAGLGEGSAFVLRLPLEKAIGQLSGVAVADEGDARGGAGVSVLVVDDNVDAAESLATILTLMGHRAFTAFNAGDALEVARAHSPEVIILDIGLPDLSGYELAAHIREVRGNRPTTLVALTGWGSDDDRRRSAQAGFDFHLTKPADTRLIRRIIARAAGL